MGPGIWQDREQLVQDIDYTYTILYQTLGGNEEFRSQNKAVGPTNQLDVHTSTWKSWAPKFSYQPSMATPFGLKFCQLVTFQPMDLDAVAQQMQHAKKTVNP